MKYLPDWLTCGGYFVYGYIYCLDFTCLRYTFTFFALYNCCYLVSFPLLHCYLVTLFPFDSVTLLLCSRIFTLLPCYRLLLCSLVTPLPSYLVTLNSYHVTLLPLLTFLPTSYPFRRLLRTLPRARYGVPSDPLSFGWPATQARLG